MCLPPRRWTSEVGSEVGTLPIFEPIQFFFHCIQSCLSRCDEHDVLVRYIIIMMITTQYVYTYIIIIIILNLPLSIRVDPFFKQQKLASIVIGPITPLSVLSSLSGLTGHFPIHLCIIH